MTFGFIGTGSMGSALARAVRRTRPGEDILLSNRTVTKAEKLAKELGCHAVINEIVAERADYIFLGAKPQMMGDLLGDLAPTLARRRSRFILVTMAVGLSIADIQAMAGGEYLVMRIMPNTPVAIGEGMILYTLGKGVSQIEEQNFLDALSGVGRFSRVPESLIDIGAAVSSSGPAFVSIFIEALVDGGVACGLPRDLAKEYAVQMVVGSSRLISESDQHPGALKDAVCSPGGTSIQGVRKLEEMGFRGAVMNAVIAACEKSGSMK